MEQQMLIRLTPSIVFMYFFAIIFLLMEQLIYLTPSQPNKGGVKTYETFNHLKCPDNEL